MQEKSELVIMLENIVEYGKYSYELEEKREESQIRQAGQMLTSFSFSTAILGAVLSLLEQSQNTNKTIIMIWLGVVFALLILSLALAMVAMWRYRRGFMRNANDMFNHVQENQDEFKKDFAFLMEWKHSFSEMHTSLSKINNLRGLLVRLSMSVFFASIVTAIIPIILYIEGA